MRVVHCPCFEGLLVTCPSLQICSLKPQGVLNMRDVPLGQVTSQNLSMGGHHRGRGRASLHSGTKRGSESLGSVPKDTQIGPKSGPRFLHSSPSFIMMIFET